EKEKPPEEQQPNVPDPKPGPKLPDPKPPEAKAPDVKDLAIRQPKLEGDRKTILLPGKVTDVCAGGDGRFIFCHCADEKKLLVYDASEGVIVKEITTAGKDTFFAACLTKLLVADN